jgi:hypothetical protein
MNESRTVIKAGTNPSTHSMYDRQFASPDSIWLIEWRWALILLSLNLNEGSIRTESVTKKKIRPLRGPRPGSNSKRRPPHLPTKWSRQLLWRRATLPQLLSTPHEWARGLNQTILQRGYSHTAVKNRYQRRGRGGWLDLGCIIISLLRLQKYLGLEDWTFQTRNEWKRKKERKGTLDNWHDLSLN